MTEITSQTPFRPTTLHHFLPFLLSKQKTNENRLQTNKRIIHFCNKSSSLNPQVVLCIHSATKRLAEMRLAGILLILLVVALDVTAGILGLRAYQSQNQVRHVEFLFIECRRPSHEAYALGIAAASLLLLAHVIANVAGGCICFGSREQFEQSPTTRQVAGICLVLMWLVLAIAFTLLVLGAMYNEDQRNLSCSLSRHKFLWIGALLCFVHGAVSAAFYAASTSLLASPLDKPPMSGISMS